jgi:hypothetical protein
MGKGLYDAWNGQVFDSLMRHDYYGIVPRFMTITTHENEIYDSLL